MIHLITLVTFLTLISSLSAYANDRPTGIPLEARWVKVDPVTDGDTIVLM